MPQVEVDGLRLHYREAGEGPPVLLLHGWPTSSFLYRRVMTHVAQHSRAIALDLPGFGESDKLLDAVYDFDFHRRMLDGFLAKLGVAEVGLVVHDLGGPVGLYWAVQQLDRVTRLALLNTLVYPQLGWAAAAFIVACRVPGVSHLLTSPWGLRMTMRFGMRTRPSDEVVRAVQGPFATGPARRVLAKTGAGLHRSGLREIATRLPAYRGPVRVIYGERDWILPDVAKTMARVKRDLPQAEITALPDCGHFLQEDAPDRVGELLAAFFRP